MANFWDVGKTFSDVSNDVNNAIDRNKDDILNIGMNAMTMGMLGYKDGNIGLGVQSRMLDEFLGGVTGRNMQRDMLQQQENALNAEAKRRAEERAGQLQRQEQNDIMASRLAGARRVTGLLNALGYTGSSSSSATQNDFLGL